MCQAYYMPCILSVLYYYKESATYHERVVFIVHLVKHHSITISLQLGSVYYTIWEVRPTCVGLIDAVYIKCFI